MIQFTQIILIALNVVSVTKTTEQTLYILVKLLPKLEQGPVRKGWGN